MSTWTELGVDGLMVWLDSSSSSILARHKSRPAERYQVEVVKSLASVLLTHFKSSKEMEMMRSRYIPPFIRTIGPLTE